MKTYRYVHFDIVSIHITYTYVCIYMITYRYVIIILICTYRHAIIAYDYISLYTSLYCQQPAIHVIIIFKYTYRFAIITYEFISIYTSQYRQQPSVYVLIDSTLRMNRKSER